MFQMIMFFYVYVLESNQHQKLYIGYTDNLKRRLKEHNQKLNQSTKPYVPWHIIYYEACRNQQDAKRREKYIKSSQGGRMLKARLKEYFFHRRFA